MKTLEKHRMVSDIDVQQDRCTWIGEVTWRHTATLREQLLDLLELHRSGPVYLDVSAVERIDRIGVALLVGSNHRAHAMHRELVLVDRAGLVTNALRESGVSASFRIDALPPAGVGSFER